MLASMRREVWLRDEELAGFPSGKEGVPLLWARHVRVSSGFRAVQ